MFVYLKESAEKETVTVRFTERLDSGEVITSVAATVKDADGHSYTAPMVAHKSVQEAGCAGAVTLQGGADGLVVYLEIDATTNQGHIYSETVKVIVRNPR